MNRVRRASQTALVAMAVVTLWPGVGFAEAGDGFRAGSLKISPSLTLSGTYDGNVFRRSGRETGGGTGVRSAPVVAIAPGLDIETVDPTNFNFKLDGSAAWDQYLSSERGLQRQSGLRGSVGASGVINPNGGLSFKLSDDLVYTNEPAPYIGGDPYNRLVNRAGATLGIHPGDRILRLDLGYQFSLFRYLTSHLLDLNKRSHDFGLDFTWRFLPKTAFVIQGDFSMVRYQRDVRGFGATELANVDSNPLKVKGGLSGLLSRRISARLMGGYANGFYEEGQNYGGPIADVSLAYMVGNLDMDNELRASYRADFNDSPVGNYYGSHTGELSYKHNFLDKRLGLDAALGYTYRAYSELPLPDGPEEGTKQIVNRQGDSQVLSANLQDNLFTADVGFSANITKWWSASLGYGFQWNATQDFVDVVGEGGTTPEYLRNYRRHSGTLSTTFRY